MKWARTAAITLLALAAAVIVIRGAFVTAYSESDPRRAAAAWPSHPAAVFRAGLIQIGEAAAAGRPVPADLIDAQLRAARSAPLAPEPFLVRGVQQRVAGDEAAAGRAFAEAKRRDPRSIPARFFLADHHLRSGSVAPGLAEVAELTRFVPGSAARLAPILAGYARTPGAAPQMKSLFAAYPDLESGLLHFLSADVGNADLILSLASGRRDQHGNRPEWHVKLVEGLAADGQYDRAHAVWTRLMGRPAGESSLLFDPRFEQLDAMRPFGWSLQSSGAGLVEPEQGGLHILYYGRENVTLATQILRLAPGRHELAMKVANGGKGAASLAWTISCLPKATTTILNLDLVRAAASKSGHRFEVPVTGCAAQRIALVGTAPDFPATVDLTLTQLRLSRGSR